MDWKGIGRTAGNVARDSLTSLAHGIVDGGEALAGLANMATRGGSGWLLDKAGYDPEGTHRFLDTLYTPKTRQAVNAVEDARGVKNTITALYENPRALGFGLVRQVPTSVGGAKIASKLRPAVNAAAQKYAAWKAGGELYKLPKPGIGSYLAASALGKGIVGAGQGAEEIRQEAPTAPWTLAKTGQAITRGGIEGLMEGMAGYGLRNLAGGPTRTAANKVAQGIATDSAVFPVAKTAENANRQQAFRDYTRTTDMMM